jgi:hypothetical protein
LSDAYFEERFMTEDLANSSAVVRHPSVGLYDRVFAVALPTVAVIAAQKKVALREDEYAPLLRHAMENMRRKAMRRVLHGNEAAIHSIQLAINHSLDVVASMRLVCILRGLNHQPALLGDALVQEAEKFLRMPSANDVAPTTRVWGDPVKIVEAEILRQLGEQVRPRMTLPESITVRSIISPATKAWDRVAARQRWEASARGD